MAKRAAPKTKAKAKKTGRPSLYSQEIADIICSKIAGGKSLRSICSVGKIPSIETVRRWLSSREKADFCAQYMRAREEQADYYADEIIEIADTEGDSNKARVRIDARKWVASKLKPKKYGDKQHLEVSGELAIDKLSDVELKQQLKSLMDKAMENDPV